MSKKTYIILYIAIAIIIIAMVVYYRKNLLPDSLNQTIDNIMETNYTPAYIATANARFNTAVINPAHKSQCDLYLSKARANKATYQAIANAVNSKMPYYFIACIHARESDCNFNTHLHNGDSLNDRTTHVPSGRPKAAPANGSRYTFVESATDALLMKGLNKWNDWSIAGMVYLFEKYNGWGYAYRKVVSPYVWSGTQFYTSGKFVADGVYNSKTVDQDTGAATLLKHFINNNI
jgi:lysozyme family protein